MGTSALYLQELLAGIASQKQHKEPFLKVAAGFLGYEGPGANLKALKCIVELTEKVHSDFEAMELEEQAKQPLRAYLANFNGILSLSQVHLDLGTAKANFLKPDLLVGLIHIHSALSGKVERFEFGEQSIELAEALREVRTKLAESDVSEPLKSILLARVGQLIVALENYNFLGADNLSAEIEVIVGTLIMRVDKEEEKQNPEIFSNIKQLIFKTVKGLDEAVRTSRKVVTVAENALKLIERGKAWIDLLGGAQ